MWKSIGFLALWLIGSCVAIAVAWAGVAVVDDEIVHPAPAAVFESDPGPVIIATGDAIEEALDSASDASLPPATATSAAPPSTVPTVPVDGAALSETAPPASLPSTPTTSVPSSTPPVSAPTVPVPTTTASPVTTTTTLPPPTTTVAASITQTFPLIGGTAVVEFSAAGVTVQFATPNPGFAVTVEPESPGLKIEFRSDTHRSRVDVWWSAGPQSEIREEADN